MLIRGESANVWNAHLSDTFGLLLNVSLGEARLVWFGLSDFLHFVESKL